MNSSAPLTCQKCGKAIIEGSPRGLCALCLISAVARSDEPPPFDAPSPELDDLRAAFPQLEILEVLGAGGMGRVYKARQPHLDRVVALKLLPPAYAADPEWVERFTREGRALARLNHPNIVQVFDFGEADARDGTVRFPFLLMEYVDGVNLRQALRSGVLTAREALTIVPSVCAALQYAHDQGVLHRDIKPENILLDTQGRVKIADFGLAKLRGDTSPSITLTATGAQLGTAAYMAPEQIEHPQDVDHRADIYSLGVVFYELLTGELPLGRFAAPSEKSGTDPRLDTIVFRTLEKERERRFQSATEMKSEVDHVASTPPSAPVDPDEWMIRCATCGRTTTLAAIGGIRIGAASIGKRTLIRCSQCGGLREGIIAKLRDLPPGTVPVAPAGTMTLAEENKPPLSKTAVAGAVLVALGIPFLIGAAIFVGLIAPLLTLPPISAAFIGLVPAIAGTICGWVGIGQIRASAGKLRGAGLATFAALFYPALLLIAFAGALTGRLFSAGWPAVAGMILALVATAWTARALCRYAERAAENTAPKPVRWPWFVGTALGVIVGLLPLGALILPYLSIRSPLPAGFLSPSAVMADVVTPEAAPFIGRLPQGSIELLGVSYNPYTGGPRWNMDGSPTREDFPARTPQASPGVGERGYEFVFRTAGLPAGSSLVTWKVENALGWGAGESSVPGQPGETRHTLAASLPSTLRATDIRVAFGIGEWESVFESSHDGPGSTNPTHRGVTWRLAWTPPVETKDGRTVTNWNVPRDPNWETRVVAVRKDGTELATSDRSHANDQATYSFRDLPLHELKTFRFEVRKLQWVEFRGIKLAPSKATARVRPNASDALQDEMKNAPLSPEDQLIFNARQHLNHVGREVNNPLGIAAAERGLAVAEARGDAVKIATANLTLARTRLSHERVRRERGYPADIDLAEAERVVKEAEQALEAARNTAKP